jgi:alpha-1,6-mannosyltransferase
MHIVDTTLFFAPHSGGVKRYLLAKNSFLARVPGVRHTLVVAGPRNGRVSPSQIELRSPKIPCGGGYRVPLNMPRWRASRASSSPTWSRRATPTTWHGKRSLPRSASPFRRSLLRTRPIRASSCS